MLFRSCTATITKGQGINNGHKVRRQSISQERGSRLSSFVLKRKFTKRLLKYQSLLLEGPVTKLKVCGNLNPATFLPEKENETPDHDCSQLLTFKLCSSGGSKGYPIRQS